MMIIASESSIHAAFAPDGKGVVAAINDRVRYHPIDWPTLRAQLLASTTACLSIETSERFTACEKRHGR